MRGPGRNQWGNRKSSRPSRPAARSGSTPSRKRRHTASTTAGDRSCWWTGRPVAGRRSGGRAAGWVGWWVSRANAWTSNVKPSGSRTPRPRRRGRRAVRGRSSPLRPVGSAQRSTAAVARGCPLPADTTRPRWVRGPSTPWCRRGRPGTAVVHPYRRGTRYQVTSCGGRSFGGVRVERPEVVSRWRAGPPSPRAPRGTGASRPYRAAIPCSSPGADRAPRPARSPSG